MQECNVILIGVFKSNQKIKSNLIELVSNRFNLNRFISNLVLKIINNFNLKRYLVYLINRFESSSVKK